MLAHKRFNPSAKPEIPCFPRENAESQPSKDHLKFSFKLKYNMPWTRTAVVIIRKVKQGTKILCQRSELFAFKHKPKLHLPQARPSRCPEVTSTSCAHADIHGRAFPSPQGPGKHGAAPAAQLSANTSARCGSSPCFRVWGFPKSLTATSSRPLTLCPSPAPRSHRTHGHLLFELSPEPKAPAFLG